MRTGSSQCPGKLVDVIVFRRTARFFLAATVTTVAFGLSGCGAEQQPVPQVPSLPSTSDSGTPGSASAAPSTAPEVGRPRERIDMTVEEREAMAAPYQQCLVANGFDKSRYSQDPATRTNIDADWAKASAACATKEPLPPWEQDPGNPRSKDFTHAVVLCLRAKGVRYVEEAPSGGYSLGGESNDSQSISKGMQYAPECEKQVAAQGIGR